LFHIILQHEHPGFRSYRLCLVYIISFISSSGFTGCMKPFSLILIFLKSEGLLLLLD